MPLIRYPNIVDFGFNELLAALIKASNIPERLLIFALELMELYILTESIAHN